MSIFAFRAISKLGLVSHPVIDLMVRPETVFVLFLVAALIVVYPLLKGVKALIITPIIVTVIGVFVYAYYILQ